MEVFLNYIRWKFSEKKKRKYKILSGLKNWFGVDRKRKPWATEKKSGETVAIKGLGLTLAGTGNVFAHGVAKRVWHSHLHMHHWLFQWWHVSSIRQPWHWVPLIREQQQCLPQGLQEVLQPPCLQAWPQANTPLGQLPCLPHTCIAIPGKCKTPFGRYIAICI